MRLLITSFSGFSDVVVNPTQILTDLLLIPPATRPHHDFSENESSTREPHKLDATTRTHPECVTVLRVSEKCVIDGLRNIFKNNGLNIEVLDTIRVSSEILSLSNDEQYCDTMMKKSRTSVNNILSMLHKSLLC